MKTIFLTSYNLLKKKFCLLIAIIFIIWPKANKHFLIIFGITPNFFYYIPNFFFNLLIFSLYLKLLYFIFLLSFSSFLDYNYILNCFYTND